MQVIGDAALQLWETAITLAPVATEQALGFLANPWVRAAGLAIAVYATIRVIASVYSGDLQNSEMGPLGIRPHAAQRLDRRTILLPRLLMPMNMDGVQADCRIFYVFTDARGKRRQALIHSIRDARLAVSPVKLQKVSATIYGQEIPDLATEDVCFPPFEVDQEPTSVKATPERAQDYAAAHNIVENWREDDEALVVSVHTEVQDEINVARMEFIAREAEKVRRAREGNFFERMGAAQAARQRPNVVGSFYFKFEFSHEPWFVLTRHPDRDLKMTAWLTVLTSMFAMLMESWPSDRSPSDAPQIEIHAQASENGHADSRK